jgi:hypothetical protein
MHNYIGKYTYNDTNYIEGNFKTALLSLGFDTGNVNLKLNLNPNLLYKVLIIRLLLQEVMIKISINKIPRT